MRGECGTRRDIPRRPPTRTKASAGSLGMTRERRCVASAAHEERFLDSLRCKRDPSRVANFARFGMTPTLFLLFIDARLLPSDGRARDGSLELSGHHLR